jgi:hypothetical protein
MPNGPVSRHATAPLAGRAWRGILIGPPAWMPIHEVYRPFDSGADRRGVASDKCDNFVSVTRGACPPAN